MKLLAIIGSPRGMKGNTGQVLGAVLEGARAAGAETVEHSLADLTVKPCVGCDACHKTGTCAIKDDFHMLSEAMRKADAIILASPNYIVSVSAQMKALFDRCCGLLHIIALEGKYAAAVVTAGGGGCEEVGDYILSFERALGCRTVGSVGADARQLVDEKLAGEVLQQARDFGARIVAAVEAQETMPEQEPEREAFRERMKQLVTTMRERWPYEYEYWQKAGRL